MGDGADARKRLADFRVGFCMLVRFASDRRTYQGEAKRTSMQKVSINRACFMPLTTSPMKMDGRSYPFRGFLWYNLSYDGEAKVKTILDRFRRNGQWSP